jgi:hypothetical protein
MSDTSFKYNHSDEIFIIAAVRNDTLKLTVDNKGLKVRVKVADTTVGRDLYEMVKCGLINKQSFAFTIEEEAYDQHTSTRTIKKIKTLFDCSAVDRPAYPQTSLYVCDPAEVERLRSELKENGEVEKLRSEIKEKVEVERLRSKLKEKWGYERLLKSEKKEKEEAERLKAMILSKL